MRIEAMLKRMPFFAILLAVALLACFLFTPSSIEIRIDCGDLRYARWGIPIGRKPMSEPERTSLMAVSCGSKILGDVWVPVVRQTNSYDHADAYYGFYREAAKWDAVDRTLCRLMVEDIGGKIKEASGKFHIAPDWLGEFDGLDPRTLGPHWSNNPILIKYCRERGYVITPHAQPGPL